ncbi:MAG TPA: hypothetical protein VLI04_00865 [Nocardioidaceae bacterium]|nr:hypothetical protein [Nocardioidaceae bacterium]
MGEAGQVRRAGRLQQVAYDATPLNTLAPDLDARLGWLLAMSRLYSSTGEYVDGTAFVRGAAEHGVTISRSLVSRWESGDIPASFEGLTCYEAVLGLPPGTLSGLASYVRTALPAGSRPVRPALDAADPRLTARLDELLDRAEKGDATSLDWQQLGWHCAAVPHLHLRQDSWRTLAGRIVGVVPRALGRSQLLLHNAVTDLATIPRSHEFLLDAIESYLADPAAQVVTTPFSLLERIPHPRARDLVLDMFEDPRTPPLIMLSVSMVTQMVTRGEFTDDQRARLGVQVLRQWRADPERSASRLAELIAVLPEGLRSPLTDAADRSGQDTLSYAVKHGEARAGTAARLSAEVAAGARARTPGEPAHGEDRMLPRLVREMLFHRHQERRHLATLLIAASPFAAGVCDELLLLLADDGRSGDVRLTAAWATRYLVRDAHRMRLLRLVDHADEVVAAPVTLALGHLGFEGVSDQVLRAALGRDLSNQGRAAMYALGMTGSPSLAGLARSTGAPDWQRRAAQWWESHGSAVQD